MLKNKYPEDYDFLKKEKKGIEKAVKIILNIYKL